jgi:hypothetical protein
MSMSGNGVRNHSQSLVYSELLTSTAGTGWIQPQRAAGRRIGRAQVDGFFFKTILYLFHIRVRLGYHGYGLWVFFVVSIFFAIFVLQIYFYFAMS